MIHVDYKARTVEIDGVKYKEGDYISINGSTGEVYAGEVATKPAEVSGDFAKLMDLCDKYTKLVVRTNADTPHDAQVAANFGAVGIGLCRTEHMFFEKDKIKAMREMILADNTQDREKALEKLLPLQQKDFYGMLKCMDGKPVNIRLLDPPLHEFVPHDLKGQQIMAEEMGVSLETIKKRVDELAQPHAGSAWLPSWQHISRDYTYADTCHLGCSLPVEERRTRSEARDYGSFGRHL